MRDVRSLATLTRRSMTEVVGSAVRAELDRERRRIAPDERAKEIERILEEIRALPILGPVPTDDDFYDKDGFPK